MIKILHQLIKIFIYITIFIIFINCKKNNKNNLQKILTNDSVSLWDRKIYDSIVYEDSVCYFERFESISFDINKNCELYFKNILNKRIIKIIGPIKNKDGLCNKWEIINDSMIKINCSEIYLIEIKNRDTLILYDENYTKKNELFRVHNNWNIDKASLIKKKEAIESEDYLDPIVW